ncbi:38133_t:CDS:1, partial [Gigaspora margarita]
MQQASDNIPVTEKENTPSLTQEPNQLTSTPQAGIILGLPTLDSHNRNNESWADEFEEVTRTTNNVSSDSIMGNDKDSKNSPANAHEMRLSRENGYTNKHAENRATDLSDQTQPQLVSVQAMPTDASHMESYDTNTNLATHYINSSIQTTQANNPYEIKDSPSKDRRVNNQKKPWTSLFAKLTRGASTYSTFSVRNQITTKNNRAAIFDIRTLNNISMTDIVVVLNKSIGKDILGLKPHFTKGIRTHLEIIFKSYDNVQKYSTEGISLFNQTFLGYIPTNSRNSYLSVKLKNVPIDFQESITKEIKDTFEH